jgi:hypothetical protein
MDWCRNSDAEWISNRRVGWVTLRGLAIALALFSASAATALTFQVDFTSSTYQVQAGDTYADLLAQFQSETIIATNTLAGLEGVSAPVYAGGVNQDYGLLMTTTVVALQGGQYTFEVGTDWGRGGGWVLVDEGTGLILDEFVTTDDVWWNNDWNDPDVFTTTANLVADGTYTFGWIGFEGCCGGQATVRFYYEGALFGNLDTGKGGAFIATTPEPGSGILVGIGLAILSSSARAGRSSQRDRSE